MTLKTLAIIMLGLFLFGTLIGGLTAFYLIHFSPRVVEDIITQMRTIIGFTPKPYRIETALNIFTRNTIVMLIILASGLSIIVPGFIVFANGAVLGFLVYVVIYRTNSIILGVLSVAPHGVIELPALFIAAALGTKIGMDFWGYVIRKKKENLLRTLRMTIPLLAIIMVLLALASIIETYVTPYVLKSYLGT